MSYKKAYNTVYLKDGDFFEFQAKKEYSNEDLEISQKTGEAQLRITVANVGPCSCKSKAAGTNDFTKVVEGDSLKIFLNEELARKIIEKKFIKKGYRYRIYQKGYMVGIMNLTEGYDINDVEQVQDHNNKEKLDVHINEKDAVRESRKEYEEEKEKLLRYRAISQAVENRHIKALAFAKTYLHDEIAIAIIASSIVWSFNHINSHSDKKYKYVPSLELEEIKEEEKNIKENTKEQLK